MISPKQFCRKKKLKKNSGKGQQLELKIGIFGCRFSPSVRECPQMSWVSNERSILGDSFGIQAILWRFMEPTQNRLCLDLKTLHKMAFSWGAILQVFGVGKKIINFLDFDRNQLSL